MGLLCFHGTDLHIAQTIASGNFQLAPSMNEFEWLGAGVYFWIENLDMAKSWAIMRYEAKKIGAPAVISAEIDCGNCLNINDPQRHPAMIRSFNNVVKICDDYKVPVPINEKPINDIPANRKLDCSVIDNLHAVRRLRSRPAFDTVRGMFEDGEPIFPGSAIRKKTHAQIAVRNWSRVSNLQVVWKS